LSHSRIVPSVTDSPIWGMLICTVVARVAIRTSRVSPLAPSDRTYRAGGDVRGFRHVRAAAQALGLGL
jgi:hypothetical protein